MSAVGEDRMPGERAEQAGAWCARMADSALSPEEFGAFEAWLGADPGNREAFDRALIVWQALEVDPAAPELVAGRVDALRSLHDSPRLAARRPSRRALAAIAASLLLMLFAGFAVLSGGPVDYRTEVGERRIVTLDDGSRVSMDGATRVEVDFSDQRRELRLLAGRARFDVEGDPLRPFVVAAGSRSVVATGTSFSVELVAEELRVVLYEGRVAVLGQAPGTSEPPDGDRPDRTRMPPGTELVFSGDAPAGRLTRIGDPARSLAWESGRLDFDREPLVTAVERINRHTDQRFVVGDPVAARIRISGVFHAGDARSFLEGVTRIFPVEAHRRGDDILLVAPGGAESGGRSIPIPAS